MWSLGQKQITNVKGPIDALGSDGTYLYICSNESILQLNPEDFSEVQNFSSPSIVKYDYLDCRQPLKVFAFSEYAQTYVLLDQFLNSTGGKRLINLDVSYSPTVTPANDGSVWTIDQPTQSLRKIDPIRNLQYLTVPIDRFSRGDLSALTLIKEASNRLFLLVEGDGILQLDIYGNYLGKIAEGQIKWFDVTANKIYYLEDMTLYEHVLKDGKASSYHLSFKPSQLTVIGPKAYLTDGMNLYSTELD